MTESTKSFRITYDPEIDAAYIYLQPIAAGGVSHTILVDVPNGSVHLDIDRKGMVVGIEVLSARTVLPESLLS